MSIPEFRQNHLQLEYPFAQDLQMAYLDNHHTTAGATLLLLHGLFDNKDTWRDLAPLLGRQFRLIAPDLVGFGHSHKPRLGHLPVSQRYAISMHADFLRVFIDQLELDQVILAGNSLGGGLALYLWCTCPDLRSRIRGLVLIGAAGYPQALPDGIRELGRWPGRVLDSWLGHWLAFRLGLVSRAARKTFARVFFDPGKIPPDMVAASIERQKEREIFYVYRMTARNLAPPDHEQLVAQFREITCPTLIVWGREDRIISPLFALRFKEDIPHAELCLLDQCGHAPHLECPEAVANAITDWTAIHLTLEKKVGHP